LFPDLSGQVGSVCLLGFRAGDTERGDGRDRLAAHAGDVPLAAAGAANPARFISRAPTAASSTSGSASVSTRQIVVFDGRAAGMAPARRYRSARTAADTSATDPSDGRIALHPGNDYRRGQGFAVRIA
jgi:hypothetical protein